MNPKYVQTKKKSKNTHPKLLTLYSLYSKDRFGYDLKYKQIGKITKLKNLQYNFVGFLPVRENFYFLI